MIREVIVTTRTSGGHAHIAPMGVHVIEDALVIGPFKPSKTLDNLLREPRAAINYTDDVRIFAGCLTGRRDWPVCATDRIDGLRLTDCLAHAEIEVTNLEEDVLRPRFHCRVIHEATHASFQGFNRAQGAVIELAILVSRLDRLPRDKIEQEIEYLKPAIDKTAGAREREAWGWLMAEIDIWRAGAKGAS
ncbi:MAG TPA: DUF447 domain-containing protein [Gammaproteobacteria bacterium]|jgi:hypothetical protein|nr:DUF447 domain-containing protein [Gammaproteobacteria bacterium]